MIADENESKSIYLKNIIKYFTNLKDKVFKEKFFFFLLNIIFYFSGAPPHLAFQVAFHYYSS